MKKEIDAIVLTSLLMFSYPHLKTAQENFAKHSDRAKGRN